MGTELTGSINVFCIMLNGNGIYVIGGGMGYTLLGDDNGMYVIGGGGGGGAIGNTLLVCGVGEMVMGYT